MKCNRRTRLADCNNLFSNCRFNFKTVPMQAYLCTVARLEESGAMPILFLHKSALFCIGMSLDDIAYPPIGDKGVRMLYFYI